MLQDGFQSSKNSSRRGYILVLVAFGFVSLFSLGALAIDAARLYWANVAFSKALREAGLTVLARRADLGFEKIYGGDPQYTGVNPRVNPTYAEGVNGKKYKYLACVGIQAVYSNMKNAGFDITTFYNTSGGGFDLDACRADTRSGAALPTSKDNLTTPATNNSNPLFVPNDDETSVDGIADGIRYFSFNKPTPSSIPTEELRIRGKYYVSTFLWGRIPFLKGCRDGLCGIETSAEIKLDPVYITLVLDTSGSMRCRASNNDCTGAISDADSKMRALKTGVTSFIKTFNPFKDYIGVVPYNLIAHHTIINFKQGATIQPYGSNTTRYTNLLAYIEALQPRAATNPCDGLVKASAVLDDVPADARAKGNSFIVFFTDGAPNAGVYNFIKPPPPGAPGLGAPPNLYPPPGAPAFDSTTTFLMYEVSWTNSSSNLVKTQFSSPTVLIELTDTNRSLLYDYSPNNTGPTSMNTLFPANYGGPGPGPTPLAGIRVCGDESAVPFPPAGQTGSNGWRVVAGRPVPSRFDRFLDNQATSLQFAGTGKGCLRDHLGFRVYMGGDKNTVSNYTSVIGKDINIKDYDYIPVPTPGFPAPIPPPTPGKPPLIGRGNTQPDQVEDMAYMCAVAAADYIRANRNASIYAIGVSTSYPNAFIPNNDPYQNKSEAFYRHDNFMYRLAADPGYAFGTGANPDFQPRRVITIPPIAANSLHPRPSIRMNVGTNGLPDGNIAATINGGAYFPLDNATNISEYFGKIAHEILLRVSS